MALLLIEGFEGIVSVADMTAKGYNVTGTPVIGSTGPTPRTGNGRIKFNGNGSLYPYQHNMFIPFPSIQNVFFGCSIYPEGDLTQVLPNDYTYSGLFTLTNMNCSIHVNLSITGYLRVYIGSTLFGSSIGIVPLNTWTYIEFNIKASNTVGIINIKINGTEDSNWTNIDTLSSGTLESFESLRLSTGCLSGKVSFDDIYIDNSTFHGDCKVELLLPNGAGNYTQFTPSTGSNYTCVDEAVPNDADYVEDSVVGDKDSYNFEALSSDNIIEGVQLNIRAEKTDAGSKEIRGFTRINSTDYNGNTLALSNTSYLYNKKIWEVNPNTSTAWTKTTIDAAEFGVEITV